MEQASEPRPSLAIIVGIVPEAELGDRPTAYSLAGAIARWLREHAPAPGADPLGPPIIVSDVWALNDPDVSRGPRIAIGGPRVNALTASLVESLPQVLVADGRFQIQMDLERPDPVAACWGVDAAATGHAAGLFSSRYLGLFLGELRSARRR